MRTALVEYTEVIWLGVRDEPPPDGDRVLLVREGGGALFGRRHGNDFFDDEMKLIRGVYAWSPAPDGPTELRRHDPQECERWRGQRVG